MFTANVKSRRWFLPVFNNFLNLSSNKSWTFDEKISGLDISRRNFSCRLAQNLSNGHYDNQNIDQTPSKTPRITDPKIKKERPVYFNVVTDKVTMEQIVFQQVHPDKFSEVILHLRYNFFADEPLNRSVNLCEPGQPNEELEEFSLSILKQGASFMAVIKNTGEVVGALLNGVECEDKPSSYEKETFKDKNLQKIFDFLKNVGNDVEMLTQYKLSSIFEMKIISVDFRFRGRGIAGKLYEMAEQYARDKGYKLLRTDATAFFSQKLFEKYGFTTIKKITYAQYPTVKDPFFITEYPHLCFKLMVKKLD